MEKKQNKIERLSSICNIQIGRTPSRSIAQYWGAGIPWVSISDMDSYKYLKIPKEEITTEGFKDCKCRLIPSGTVLLSFKLSIGKVAITSFPVVTNEAIAALEILDENIVNIDYLYWCLKSQDLTAGSDKAVKGITLNKKKLQDIPIPLPPLSEQKRIADILDKADSLCQKRKESIALLDELLKSVFIDMFGDPVSNEKGWEVRRLGEVCNVTKLAGFEYSKYIKYKSTGEIIVIRGLNVKNRRLKLDQIYFIEKEISDLLKRSKLFKNDIVMTYIGVNIGDVAIIHDSNKFHLAPNVSKMTVKDLNVLNPNYLLYLLSLSKLQMMKYSTNTAKQALNMSKIRELLVPLPPINLQNDFSEKLRLIDSLEMTLQKSSSELNVQFNALLQRAFRGDRGCECLNQDSQD